MNLEEIEKRISKKKEKGVGAAGPTPPPFRPSQQPGLPPPPLSLPRVVPALPNPATATWRPYAGVGRAAADHLHPPGRDADPRPQTTPSLLSPAPLPPSSVRAAAAAVPPRAIAGESPAARRRPHQSSKLDAKSTSALAVAAVSPCVRSTEGRSSRAP